MYIKIRKLRITKSIILSVVLVSVFQFGCTVYTSKDFIPIESQQPVTMFERYALRMTGYKYSIHNDIAIHVDFLNPVSDTTPLENIPIFVIDSLCFEGTCMNSLVCHQPRNAYDELQLAHSSAIVHFVPDKDLQHYEKQLKPLPYYLKNVSWLPKKCNNQNVLVSIHARLLDRTTSQTIAQESKKIEYFIKKKTTLNAGS